MPRDDNGVERGQGTAVFHVPLHALIKNRPHEPAVRCHCVVDVAEDRTERFVVKAFALPVYPEEGLAQRAAHLFHVIGTAELPYRGLIVEIGAVSRKGPHTRKSCVGLHCHGDAVACPAVNGRAAVHELRHPQGADIGHPLPEHLLVARKPAGCNDNGFCTNR